jgi:hypothetical protein
MPVYCGNCGAQNPDGATFCSICGRPIGGAAGAQPPAAAGQAPPPGPPVATGYPPAGFPPGGGPPPGYYAAPPPRRLSTVGILAIVGGSVGLLIAVAVIIYAANGSKPSPTPSPLTPTVSPVPATATPLPTPGPGSPTPPATSPTPAPTMTPAPPQPSPTPNPGLTNSFSNDAFALSYGGGWTLDKHDSNSADFLSPSENGWNDPLFFDSNNGGGKGVQPVATDLNNIFQSIVKTSPDAKVCRGPTSTTLAGVSGEDVVVCYTFTPQNGKATPVYDEYFIANSPGDKAFFEVGMWSPQDLHDQLLRDAAPIIATIQWKLH